jgi:uroporphyrin-III C-methyltransferase/precorrin-2 dehydrogenase/sirohydrochlorin ferrochelatase
MAADAVPTPLLMVGLLVQGRRCVVVGSDPEAQQRVDLLVRRQARVEWLRFADEPAVDPVAGSVCAVIADPAEVDWSDVAFAAIATGDEARDEVLAHAAQAARVPVNTIDRNHLCTVFMPAVVEHGPLTLAIASGGTAPSSVRLLRQWLAANLPGWIIGHARMMSRVRALARVRLADPLARRAWIRRASDRLEQGLRKRG